MTRETFMVEEITKEIIFALMEDRSVDYKEAMRLLYTSDTYAKLIDLKTGLYTQSTPYVYEFLEKELTTGSMASTYSS